MRKKLVNIADGVEYGMPKLLSVSPSPHIKSLDTIRSVMLDVIIALLPALCWGIYVFGWRALAIVVISVLSCVVSEIVFQIVTKRTVTVADLSAVVTGLVLGLSMSSKAALWVPAIGGVFAIIVAKQLFGGIGKNIVNPALSARVFLMLCWPGQITKYSLLSADGISSATPLVNLKNGTIPKENLFNLILGNSAGAIGEVSAIALAAGFVYLLVRKTVSWQLPAGFIGTVAIVSLLFPISGRGSEYMIYQIVSGGLLLCAFVAANDYSTTPVTKNGRLIFGIGCGLITIFIRYFCSYPDGTSFAVLIMNLLVPYIEKITVPRRFGFVKRQEGGRK